MSRKDFEALARGIRDAFSEDARLTAGVTPEAWHWTHARTVKRVADVCIAANGRFDRGRFERACGL